MRRDAHSSFTFIDLTGDGDCFYRALSLAFFLRLLDAPDPGREVDLALQRFDQLKPLLDEAGFQEMVVRPEGNLKPIHNHSVEISFVSRLANMTSLTHVWFDHILLSFTLLILL